jgi:branched-chain amino acid aminotransferase
VSQSRSAPAGSRERQSSTAVWVNGERQDRDGHVSARDRGLLLADGAFETMRVRHGRLFRLDRHLARLDRGLHVLRIPAPGGIRDWVLRAVHADGEADAAVRLTVTRGVGPGGVAPPSLPEPTVVVSIGPLPAFPPAIYQRGLTGHVASGRRNERAMTNGLKTLAYVDAVVGLLEAQEAGADEAIFLDIDGHCSEASASNLFVWTGAELVTPPGTCGALPGVTRESVLELAAGLGIPGTERAFTLDDLQTAREAFLTSSLRGIAPLVRVGGRPIGDAAPGVVTRRLSDAYASLVERECAA